MSKGMDKFWGWMKEKGYGEKHDEKTYAYTWLEIYGYMEGSVIREIPQQMLMGYYTEYLDEKCKNWQMQTNDYGVLFSECNNTKDRIEWLESKINELED